MPMSLTDFSAIGCSEPLPAHTQGSQVEKGVWVLVIQMNINRMHGGLNGPGKWTDYFHVIADFTDEISKSYHVWLIKLENDCLDDVFYADFGIMSKKEYGE